MTLDEEVQMQLTLLKTEKVRIERMDTLPTVVDGYEQTPETLTFYADVNMQPAYGASDYTNFSARTARVATFDRPIEGMIVFSRQEILERDKLIRDSGEVYMVRVSQDWTKFPLDCAMFRAFVTKCEDGV